MSAAAGTAAYDVLITGSNNSIAGATTFSNTGQLTIGDNALDVTLFTGGLTATTQSAGFGAGFLRTAGGAINVGTVTFTTATTIDTTNNGAVAAGANLTLVGALGAQNLTLVAGTAGTVTLGAGTATVADLTVTADEINFTGGVGSITATGNILLQGATAATTIGVGVGAGTLELTNADLEAIANGATSITIGQSAQTGLITVDTSAIQFQDDVVIRSSGTGGEVQVDGLITASGPTTDVTLEGATLDLNAGIDTGGGAVALTGGTGGVDLLAGQTIDTAAAANSGTASGAVAISSSGAGTIVLAGNILTTGAANNVGAGSAGGAVTITGATGAVTISGNINATGGAGTRLLVAGGENGGAGGAVTLSSTTGNISITGAINSLGGAASNGEGGNGGNLSITTTTGAIGLGNINTSGGASTALNFDGGDAGTFTVNSSGGGAVTLNNSTIVASGGTGGGGAIGVDGNGAAVTFNNSVLLATGPASITTTGTAGGNISFNSTVNSASALTPQGLFLNAGTGIATFAGIVGGTAALNDLDVIAATIRLNTTSISVDGGIGGGTVGLTGAVILGANVSLDLDGVVDNRNLVVTGTVNSDSVATARNITVLAGTSGDAALGDVTITGAVGGTAPLGNITVSGAGTLTSGTAATDNVTFTGDLTASANTMVFNGTEVRSTGGGTITLSPATAGNGITLGATPVVLNALDLGNVAGIIFTSGRFVVGSTTTGAINVGTANLSGNGFSGFSFVTRGATTAEGVIFDSGESLTLPSATDIRFSTGSGNVVGQSGSRNIIAPTGTIRFTSGAVTIGAQVANLESSTTRNGFVLANSQSLTILGAQRAGSAFSASANTADYLAGTSAGNLTLASGATFTGQDITLVAAANLNNSSGAAPFTNQNGGRTLVFSTQAVDNQPPTANGGFSGFGTVYLTSPNITTTGATGTYTVNNSLPSGNQMVFSGPPDFSLIDADSATYNELVDTVIYKASVPVQGYTLPAIYTGQVRLGFKAAAAAVQNSLGKAAPAQAPERAGRLRVGDAKPAPSAGPVADAKPTTPAPGRLRVSQVQSQSPKNEVGQSTPPAQRPTVKAGNVSLRMSGEFYPFELAEVAVGSPKVSQNR
jgi:hypothetical protein